MDGAVEEKRPVEGEAPDVGRVVEVAGVAGRSPDGPVEGGPVGGQVALRDFGRRGWHFSCRWRVIGAGQERERRAAD